MRPVVYMHDGQAAFEDDTTVLARLLDGRWPALDPGGNRIADLVRNGQIREMIVVAIDALTFDNRSRDYLPPGDSYLGVSGAANNYVAFILQELKPWIDAN